MKIHRMPSWAPTNLAAWAGLGYFGHLWVRDGQEAAIPHEMVHVEQQRRDGWLRFTWRYLTSREWRVRYEAEAYALDVRNDNMTLEYAAHCLAGPLYDNVCTYEEALSKIGERV